MKHCSIVLRVLKICSVCLVTSATVDVRPAPFPILPRAGSDAGIGIELNTEDILFKNGVTAGHSNGTALEGKPLVIRGTNGTTADRSYKLVAGSTNGSTGSASLSPRYVLDYDGFKLGSGELKRAGLEIQKQLKQWSPDKTKMGVQIKGSQGSWKISRPATFGAISDINLSPTVTAGLPLEAIQHLIEQAVSGEQYVLLGKKSDFHFVRDTHVQSVLKAEGDGDLSEAAKGFLSLVIFYVKTAKNLEGNNSIAEALSIMPLTDFGAMWALVKDEFCESLWKIVSKLAKFEGKDDADALITGFSDQSLGAGVFDAMTKGYLGNSTTSNFGNSTVSNSGNSTAGYYGNSTDAISALTVKLWLETLEKTGVDLLSKANKPLGSFEVKTGTLYRGTDQKRAIADVATALGRIPVFEFQNLDSFSADKTAERIQELEDAVIELHAEHGKETILKRSSKSKKSKKCPPKTNAAKDKCKATKARTEPDGECQNCPSGKKPSAKGDSCEDHCPGGLRSKDGKTCEKKKSGGSDGDKDDKDGTKDNKSGQDKNGDSKDDDRDKDGESKDNNSKTDESKDDGSKNDDSKDSNQDQDETNKDSDSEDDSKKKDDPLKDKKATRAGFCMAFVGYSGLVDGAEMLETEEGIEALQASADIWPDDVEYKEGDLSNSNVNIDMDASPRRGTVAGINMMVSTRSFGTQVNQPVKRQLGFLNALGSIFRGGSKAGSAARGGSSGQKLAGEAAKNIGKATTRGGAGKAAQKSAFKIDELKKLSSAARKTRANEAIKKIRDDKSFRDCLNLIATEVADATLHTDIPKDWFKADPPFEVILHNCPDLEGCSGYNQPDSSERKWYAYEDGFCHNNRIQLGTCKNGWRKDFGKDGVSSYSVSGGCCAFYKDESCLEPLFSATDREDGDLGKHGNNDAISSLMCVEDQGCKGVNGHDGSDHPNAYATGWCGLHFTQYQRPKDYTGGIRMDVEIKDANGIIIGSAEDREAKEDQASVDSRAGKLSIETKGDYEINFTIGDDKFVSDCGDDDDACEKENRCSCGKYDGSKKKAGKRECDCGFGCGG